MRKALSLLLGVGLTLACANSLEQIRSANTLKIGVADNAAPFSKLNNNGEFVGFEVDLAKELAKAILGDGGRVEFIAIKQADRAKAVIENKVDILLDNFARTPERAKQIDFSIPYLSVTLAVVAPKESRIHKTGDLIGKKVLTINNTNSANWVKKNPNIVNVNCETNRECLRMLLNGEADAYMHNITNVATIPLLNEDYEVGIKRVGQVLFDCVATQKGNKDLINIIDDTILDLAAKGYFHEEYDKTFEPFYKGAISADNFILEDLYESFRL